MKKIITSLTSSRIFATDYEKIILERQKNIRIYIEQGEAILTRIPFLNTKELENEITSYADVPDKYYSLRAYNDFLNKVALIIKQKKSNDHKSLNLLAKVRGEFYSDESQNSGQLLKFFIDDLQILFYQYIKNEISIDVIIDSLIFYRKLCVNCLQGYIDVLSHLKRLCQQFQKENLVNHLMENINSCLFQRKILLFADNQELLTISSTNNHTIKTFVSLFKNFWHSPFKYFWHSPMTALVYVLMLTNIFNLTMARVNNKKNAQDIYLDLNSIDDYKIEAIWKYFFNLATPIQPMSSVMTCQEIEKIFASSNILMDEIRYNYFNIPGYRERLISEFQKYFSEDHHTAQKIFFILICIDPKVKNDLVKINNNRLYMRAKNYNTMGDYNKALELLNQLNKNDPNNVDYLHLQLNIYCYLTNSDKIEIKQRAKQLLQLEPDNEVALAMLMTTSESDEEAMMYEGHLDDLKTNNSTYHINLLFYFYKLAVRKDELEIKKKEKHITKARYYIQKLRQQNSQKITAGQLNLLSRDLNELEEKLTASQKNFQYVMAPTANTINPQNKWIDSYWFFILLVPIVGLIYYFYRQQRKKRAAGPQRENLQFKDHLKTIMDSFTRVFVDNNWVASENGLTINIQSCKSKLECDDMGSDFKEFSVKKTTVCHYITSELIKLLGEEAVNSDRDLIAILPKNLTLNDRAPLLSIQKKILRQLLIESPEYQHYQLKKQLTEIQKHVQSAKEKEKLLFAEIYKYPLADIIEKAQKHSNRYQKSNNTFSFKIIKITGEIMNNAQLLANSQTRHDKLEEKYSEICTDFSQCMDMTKITDSKIILENFLKELNEFLSTIENFNFTIQKLSISQDTLAKTLKNAELEQDALENPGKKINFEQRKALHQQQNNSSKQKDQQQRHKHPTLHREKLPQFKFQNNNKDDRNKGKEKEIKINDKRKLNIHDLIKSDARTLLANHSLDILSNTLMEETNKEFLYKKCCKYFEKSNLLRDYLFNEIIHASLLYTMMRLWHSCAQLSRSEDYDLSHLIDRQYAYAIRNNIMHRSYLAENNTNKLLEFANEIIAYFQQLLKPLLKSGSCSSNIQRQEFTSNFIIHSMSEEIDTEENDLSACLNYLQLLANRMTRFAGIAKLLKEENTLLYQQCGILHAAMITCIFAIGQRLKDIKYINKNVYHQLNYKLSMNDMLMGNKDGATMNIFHYYRILSGHSFSAEDNNNKIMTHIPGGELYVYEEIPPEILYSIFEQSSFIAKVFNEVIINLVQLKNVRFWSEQESPLGLNQQSQSDNKFKLPAKTQQICNSSALLINAWRN
jgi:cbb3-type cytochrome oxidase subunit 3